MSGNWLTAERLTTEQTAVLRALLREGRARTPALQQASGLDREDFFEALVQLEARGRVRFVEGRCHGHVAYRPALRVWEVPR